MAVMSKRLQFRYHKIIILFIHSYVVLFCTLQTSPEKVQFVISRKSRPQTPDIIRSTSAALGNFSIEESQWAMCKKCREIIINVNKVSRFIFQRAETLIS